MNGKDLRPRDISIMGDQLTQLTVADLKPLPAPLDKPEMEPGIRMGKPEIPAGRRKNAVLRYQRWYPAGIKPVHGILRKM